jgi:tetratricopeptide (TPR) repeat protein
MMPNDGRAGPDDPDGESAPPSPVPDRGRARKRRREAAKARRSVEVHRNRLALIAVGATVLLGPLLLGGALPWTSLVTAAIATVALGLVVFGTNLDDERTPSWLWVAASLLAWTALQSVPLPVAITGWLAPTAVSDARGAFAALGQATPAWVALSRAPGDTLVELVKGTAIVAILTTAYVLGSRGHRDVLLRLAAVSAVVVALVAVAHVVQDANTVFGVYVPVYGSRRVLGPLLNPNHLAGLCAMGAILSVGLAIDPVVPAERPFWVFGAMLCAGANAIAASRGGLLVLLVGVGAVGVVAHASRGSRGAPRTRTALAAALVVLMLGLAGAYALGELWPQYADRTAFDKVGVALRATMSLPTSWTVGVGRGAIGEVMTRIAGNGDLARVTHLETVPLQWVTEWGLVPAGAWIVASATATVAALRRGRSLRRRAALISVVAIGLQNLVDFSFEMTGVAVLVAATFGAALASRPQHGDAPPSRSVPLRRWLRGFAVAAALVVVVIGPLSLRWTSDALLARAEAAFRAGEHREVRAVVEDARRMQPADAATTLLGAAAAARTRDASAGALLNRAMVLAPDWAAPHLVAAEVLWSAGRRPQAWLEVREAVRRNPVQGAAWVCARLRAGLDMEGIEASAPADRGTSIRFLETIARCVEPRLAVSAVIDRMLEARGADVVGRRTRAMRRSLAAGRPADAVAAMAGVRSEQRSADESALLADALVRVGSGEAARGVLDAALTRNPDARALQERRARVAADLGRADEMRAAVEALRDLSGADPARLGGTLALLGELEGRLGQHARALLAFEQAHRVRGDVASLRAVALAAERAGRRQRALEAWKQLCEDEGPQSRSCTDRERVERASPLTQPIAPPASSEATRPNAMP